MTWLAVAIGGAFGAMLRFGVSKGAARVFGTAMPWGTLIVNAAGAFIIGFLTAWFLTRISVGPAVRAMIPTGFLGALTTFSTFSLETLHLAQTGSFSKAAANIVLNLGLSLILVWIGYELGSKV